MASEPSAVTSAVCSHTAVPLTSTAWLTGACVCFSPRWIRHRISGEDKQRNEMCLETHVCQQRAWPPGVQERNPDNGKVAHQTWAHLSTCRGGTMPSHKAAPGGWRFFPSLRWQWGLARDGSEQLRGIGCCSCLSHSQLESWGVEAYWENRPIFRSEK